LTNGNFGAARVTEVYDSIRRNAVLVAAVFVVMLAASAAYVRFAPRQYVAGANVLVVNGNTRDDPTLSSPDLPSIATSTVVLEHARADIKLDVPLQEMKRRLTAKPPPFKSSILRIQYTDSDGARAALVANAVADELANYYRDISKSRYDADLAGLNAELRKQSDRIREIDREVGPNLRSLLETGDARSATLDGGGNANGNDPQSPARERQLAKATLQGDEARLDALRIDAQTKSAIARKDILEKDALYQSLTAAVATDSATLARYRALYQPDFPGLIELERKVANLNAAVAAEEQRALTSSDAFSPTLLAAQGEERKAEAVVEADRARLAALDQFVVKERAHGTSFASLRLERDAAKENYLAISARIAAALANRADALSLGSVVVVDRAIDSETQIGLSRRLLSIVLALLILAASIGSALLADLLNPRLRRAGQIETLYGKPVIATLGNAK
jgi:capsular polysaccharide biosynthesis protein